MITESEVQRSFRKIFSGDQLPADRFEKAEELLEHLRPESPLRHRLGMELEELRKIHSDRQPA